MSGEPPEHNRDQQTSSASNSVRRYVPIAPTDHHPRVDPQLVFIPIAVSSVGGPQVTSNSMELSKAGANGVAPHKKKKERGSPTGKNVVVLKPCDVVERDGTVFMPNTIEMAKLKKAEKGQFKTNVQISSRMTDKDIKRIIVETFPFLEYQRFYCAAAVDERTRLDFHGERRIWDGRLVKQKIKGNSVLYIFAEENPTVAGQLSEHFPEQIDGTDNQSQMTVSSQSVIPSVSHKSCSNTGPLPGSMRKGAATATATAPLVHDVTASSLPTETRTARDTTPMSSAHDPQNPKRSGEGPTLKYTYEQTNKRSDQQLSKKTRTTTSVLKHKSNLKSPATRKNPYARPPPSASKKDNSIHQIKRQLPILPDYTTLFPKNNISTTTDQKSLGQPSCLNADATTSLLSVQMNNLGITNAHSLQPQASHLEKVTELQRVDDGQNSHGNSHDRPAPTSPQSNFMFRSIDCPKQTTDVSRQGTEEIVYTNLTDLTDKQLEPEHVGASAFNHEVLDPMGTTPSCSSDLNSSASGKRCASSDKIAVSPEGPILDDMLEFSNFYSRENDSSDSGIDFSNLIALSEMDDSELTSLLSPSGVDSSLTAQGSNNVGLHSQNQRHNTIQMRGPLDAMQTQVSYVTRGNNSDSGLGLQSSSSAPQSRHTSDMENSALEEYPSIIKIRPNAVGLSGAPSCEFLGLAELFPKLQSGYAIVGNLGKEILWKKGDKHGNGNCIPPSPRPGKKIVKIYSATGRKLVEAELWYVDPCHHTDDECLVRVGEKASQSYEELCRVMSNILIRCRPPASIKSGETQYSANSESSLIFQMIRFLINNAAESGLQWDSLPLLELVFMNRDHENAALFLEEITERYARDVTPEGRERGDLSGLLAAINASHKDEASDASEDESRKPDGRNDSHSSYYGDVESLLCNLEEPTSDSEDVLSDMLRKVAVTENEIQMAGNNTETDEREILNLPSGYLSGTQVREKETQPTQHSTVSLEERVDPERVSDQLFPASSDSMLPFGKNGKFSRKPIAIKLREKASKRIQGEHRIFRIREHSNIEFLNLPNLNSVHQPIICFLLNIHTESINRCFSTMDDRWRIQLQPQRLSGRMTSSPLSMLFQAIHIDPEEGTSSISLSMPAFKVENTIAQASSEILAQGSLQKTPEVYKRPLWKEKGHVKRIPGNFIGQDWTGKTSLKTSLVWKTSKNSEHSEPEPEFLFEQQPSQLIINRSLKKINSSSSYAVDLSWIPNCNFTVPLEVIEKTKELSKPTEMSPQYCKQVEKAKADSQEPSTKGIDPSLKDPQDKLRVPKQPEDIKDYLTSSVYPPVILNTNHQKTLSCAHAANRYHEAEPKYLVESSYSTSKDIAYGKLLEDPFVVTNKTSDSSDECQNVENVLLFAEKSPPTIKDLKKPLPMRGEVDKLLCKWHANIKLRLTKDASDLKNSRSKGHEKASSPTPHPRDDEETCPICLLKMVEDESLMSCQDGCNNRLHQHCMEIWAEECKRQREELFCPLCRKIWSSEVYGTERSSGRSLQSDLPSVPGPFGPEEITLPHSDPIPPLQVELTKPSIEVFGESVVGCLFSREWKVRETALLRLSKDISAVFLKGSNVQNMAAFEACCSLLSMMCGDPVYRVYVAALRTLRVLITHASYSTQDEKHHLQKSLFNVVEAILAQCANSNRRFSALCIKFLLELCKDVSGDLALGKMLGEEHEGQPLGGLCYILSCVLRHASEYTTGPWWLGRLLLLRRLMDVYITEFELSEDSPSDPVDSVGVLLQDRMSNASQHMAEIYQDNLTRLMSALKFATQAVNCNRSHSKISKLAFAVLTCCSFLASNSTSASSHIRKVVSKLKPAQRSVLRRHICAVPRHRLAFGEKCKEIIEQEEVEAVAKAMAVSSHYTGLSKIESLDTGDEMIMVFTQPESLEKAVNSNHLYLEDMHWKKGELLGTGAFSSCYAARDFMSGSLMAVKQVSFDHYSKEEQNAVTQAIEDEVSFLGRLQHPHVIKCLGATKHAAYVNIFLEWMPGGSIANILNKYGAFDEKTVISYSHQILQGVAYLHQNQVIHRDIKGGNILVDSTGQSIKIADFGAAARLATQNTVDGEFQGQLRGTLPFMAPEVLRGESYGRSSDVWSLGCVIIEMLTGRPPWNAHEHSNHLALIFKITYGESLPEIPKNISPALRDVLLRCFECKKDRPSAMDLLRHPLFTQM